tara:strand:+ start:159 stop:374 length:216 start_codon:yes stop_codon:yes gene_type:complete
MDNIIDMNKKLKQLEELLQTHDWYYAMSDDNYYYKQGRQQFEKIWELMDELKDNGYFTEVENLYDTYSPNV